MPKLIDAVLALDVVLGPTGITAMKDRIRDRDEFVRPVPSEFPVVLGFIFEAEPGETFEIATEVRSPMNRPLWFDSGKLKGSDSGRGEFAVHIPIPVRDVGPCYISLHFNQQQVWQQHVFFALQ